MEFIIRSLTGEYRGSRMVKKSSATARKDRIPAHVDEEKARVWNVKVRVHISGLSFKSMHYCTMGLFSEPWLRLTNLILLLTSSLVQKRHDGNGSREYSAIGWRTGCTRILYFSLVSVMEGTYFSYSCHMLCNFWLITLHSHMAARIFFFITFYFILHSHIPRV